MRRLPSFLVLAALLLLGWRAVGTGSYGALMAWNLCLQLTLALSYDLMGGLGGELPLGHGLFFGLGAYSAAWAQLAGLPWWVAVAAAGAGGALVAGCLRPLLVPLRGAAFALGSLGTLLLAGLLARNLESWTGGAAGLSLSRGPGLGWALGSALVLSAATLWVHDTLYRAPFGCALHAAGEDPEAAAHAGIPLARVRGYALVLGAVPAALAGGLYPILSRYVSPESAFGLEVALTPVVAVLLGGPGTRWGALLGTLLYLAVQELLWTQSGTWNLALLGFGLMAAAVFKPEGLTSRMN